MDLVNVITCIVKHSENELLIAVDIDKVFLKISECVADGARKRFLLQHISALKLGRHCRHDVEKPSVGEN
jgi:hypothetical protein